MCKQKINISQQNMEFLNTHTCVWSTKLDIWLILLIISGIKLWPHDQKLRKYLSLKLYSKHIKFFFTNCSNDLQMWTISAFKHNFKILVNNRNYMYFKSDINLKFWLKNILSLRSWVLNNIMGKSEGVQLVEILKNKKIK